ncbi:hypothetical protein A2914_02750 [Candidatus Nomurabacteria bacterium RIFCSPLOWO2_01_FULL_41_21]|uniref:Uncharacterized protein n=2 Tax=Candidatus Nomuraibacteriota TaxID=1752729 RepID=A0A1F6X3Y1_9BACT|nr:MAG: hypothetical protein A2647_02385 [Candidatus Nomurabacteria bacterium RIFCSPHIGHO2_01_FULL_40_24b]OGI88854.1 MAG: hypothetical protein A2914_02750 [Candidatus Nomurabacteria bacterium RIFCSPLOWO2_01_FULL_41_21]
MEPTGHKSSGALIGSIIIILILIIGGVYLLKNKVADKANSDAIAPENTAPTSDELSDIEADLDLNADTDSLDSGLE